MSFRVDLLHVAADPTEDRPPHDHRIAVPPEADHPLAGAPAHLLNLVVPKLDLYPNPSPDHRDHAGNFKHGTKLEWHLTNHYQWGTNDEFVSTMCGNVVGFKRRMQGRKTEFHTGMKLWRCRFFVPVSLFFCVFCKFLAFQQCLDQLRRRSIISGLSCLWVCVFKVWTRDIVCSEKRVAGGMCNVSYKLVTEVGIADRGNPEHPWQQALHVGQKLEAHTRPGFFSRVPEGPWWSFVVGVVRCEGLEANEGFGSHKHIGDMLSLHLQQETILSTIGNW